MKTLLQTVCRTGGQNRLKGLEFLIVFLPPWSSELFHFCRAEIWFHNLCHLFQLVWMLNRLVFICFMGSGSQRKITYSRTTTCNRFYVPSSFSEWRNWAQKKKIVIAAERTENSWVGPCLAPSQRLVISDFTFVWRSPSLQNPVSLILV